MFTPFNVFCFILDHTCNLATDDCTPNYPETTTAPPPDNPDTAEDPTMER